jgi:hypothetical protein
MDFLLERHADNPFVVLHLALELGVEEELWSAFEAAIHECTDLGDDFDELRVRKDPSANLNEIRRKLIGLLEEETEKGVDFLRKYIDQVSKAIPELNTEYVDILKFQETVLEILYSEEDHPNFIKFYKLNWKQSKHHLSGGKLPLLPFLDFKYSTAYPFENRLGIDEALVDILTDDDPLTVEQVRLALIEYDIVINPHYLHFVLLNSPQFLLVELDGLCVDVSDEIFPSIELAAWGIQPESYFSSDGLSYRDGRDLSLFDIDVDETCLKRFFNLHDETRFIEHVNWLEVASKLKLIRKEKVEFIQGIPSPVHGAITKHLDAKHSALRLSDIERALGINDLNLTAEKLPPGRLNAYVPGPRFLQKNQTMYVLEEWVSREGDWKQKIHASRIVTPREHKSLDFTDSIYTETIGSLSSLSEYGIISVQDLAFNVAQKIPERPNDPYHINLLKQRLEERVSRTYHSIGRGLYVDDRHEPLLSRHLGATKTRRAIAKKSLGTDTRLTEAIDSINVGSQAAMRQLL